MQKGKNAPYVTAGVQGAPGIRFNVRSSVRLPDSEAGQTQETDRLPFQAMQVRAMPRESLTVPLRGALVFLCALFVLFGGLIIGKAVRRSEYSKKISAMKSDITETEKENMELAAEVEKARDPGRISDMALKRLEMKAPASDTTEHVTAPDTRPFEQKNVAQADASPHTALDGMMAGSR